MFEHLDDPSPRRSSSEPQISAARSRGRQLLHQRHRTRLAAGSAVVAATAGVTAVAAFGLPGGATAGQSADATVLPSTAASPSASLSAAATPSATVTSPAPASSPAPTTTTAPATTAPATTPATTTAPPTSAAPTTSQPPAVTPACEHEATRLKTSVEGSGYTLTDPGSGVIAWNHPAGPLTALVVGVSCAPFSPDSISPDSKEPVQEITVLGFHSWVIGDPQEGHFELVWNADNGTEVNVLATVGAGADPAAATKELLKFGNTLID